MSQINLQKVVIWGSHACVNENTAEPCPPPQLVPSDCPSGKEWLSWSLVWAIIGATHTFQGGGASSLFVSLLAVCCHRQSQLKPEWHAQSMQEIVISSSERSGETFWHCERDAQMANASNACACIQVTLVLSELDTDRLAIAFSNNKNVWTNSKVTKVDSKSNRVKTVFDLQFVVLCICEKLPTIVTFSEN